MTWLNRAHALRLGLMAALLAAAAPALADGDAGDGADSIITPGFGTLHELIGWVWRMLS